MGKIIVQEFKVSCSIRVLNILNFVNNALRCSKSYTAIIDFGGRTIYAMKSTTAGSDYKSEIGCPVFFYVVKCASIRRRYV